MEKLFWIQNENPNTPNTLIDKDGAVISLDNSEDYGYELFNQLLKYQENFKTLYTGKNLTIKGNVNRGIFISSNFMEKDDSGRKMGFMFFTKNTSKNEVIKDLMYFSGLVKRTVVPKDLKEINRNLKVRNNQILKLIAAAIAVLIILVLWKKLN